MTLFGKPPKSAKTSLPETLARKLEFGPIVYRLGRILLKDKSRVRFSVGSQKRDIAKDGCAGT